jgi:hypothetical protein
MGYYIIFAFTGAPLAEVGERSPRQYVHCSAQILKFWPAMYSARSKEEKQLAAYCQSKNALVSDGCTFVAAVSAAATTLNKRAHLMFRSLSSNCAISASVAVNDR